MKTLDRYIAVGVIINSAFALVTLLAIFSVINLMQELEDLGSGNYGVGEALLFVLLTLPAEACELFPAAALLGCVNALGTLASRNELVAIWAAGVSRSRIVGSVMKGGVVLMLAAVVVAQLVAAPLAQRAVTRRSVAISAGLALSTAQGFWARDGSRFINVRNPLTPGELRDLYIYDFDEGHRMLSFTYARSASYADHSWRLEDLVENQFTGEAVTTRRLPDRDWPEFMSARQVRVSLFPPEYLSVRDLYRSLQSLGRRGEDASRQLLSFWRQISAPLVIGVMMFLSLPFVLVITPSVRVGPRIVAGALFGIGFQMFNQMFGQLGLVYGLPAGVTALLPAGVVLAVGVWLMSRAD